mgnify:CR=1 FL=1
MDIKLEKKPWYIRYRYYLTGGLLFISFLIYVIVLSLGPRKLRVDAENIQIAEVKDADFMEYVDVEGLIQPILTIKVNTREAGSVESIVGEEGSLLQQGDTILILSNPDLLRNIEDQRDEWEKQMITYQEQEIEMEQKSLNLKQQALTNNYELERLKKSIALDREEYQMGNGLCIYDRSIYFFSLYCEHALHVTFCPSDNYRNSFFDNPCFLFGYFG